MRIRLAVLAYLGLLIAPNLIAQTSDATPSALTPQNNTGALPYSTSIGSDTEQVELSSGNLIVNIPFVDVPGRKMAFDFGIRFDARYWSTQAQADGNHWVPEMKNWLTATTLGWTPTQAYVTYLSGKVLCINDTGNNGPGSTLTYQGGGTWRKGLLFTDHQGQKHSFNVNQFQSGSCDRTSSWTTNFDASNYVGPSTDLTGFYADFRVNGLPRRIVGPDGTSYSVGGSSGGTSQSSLGKWFSDYATESDLRGNLQVLSAGGTDSVGRVPVAEQTSSSQLTYTFHDSNGAAQIYTVNLATVSVNTNFATAYAKDYSGSRQVVSSVVLPNQRSYSFQYNAWGEITQITFPSGAVATYQWNTVNIFSVGAVRAVTQRVMSHDGASDTWDIAYANIANGGQAASYSVTLTNPSDAASIRSQTKYTYDVSQHLTRVQYLSSPQGTQVLQYDLTWDPTRFVANGAYENSLLASITTTLENSQVSLKKFQYDLYAYPSQDPCATTLGSSDPCIALSNSGSYGPPTYYPSPNLVAGSHGNVTSIQEYDWGNGQPGPLLRQTIRTYLHDTTSGYFVASAPANTLATTITNIANRVASESIYDGAALCNGTGTFNADGSITPPASCQANLLARTNVTYDNGNPGTYGYLGEATSISHWNNNPGGSAPTSSYVYDSYGNITSVTDANGKTTQYGYADAWSGSTACATQAAANAYVTTIKNALQQQQTLSYYECSGRLAVHKDANDLASSGPGTAYTYDWKGRQTSVTFPDGGRTNTAFDDSALTQTVDQYMTASQTREIITQLDQLGRATQTRLTSDPGGTVYTDTSYDSLGRVSTVSNPYFSQGKSTAGTTSFVWDARSRKTKETESDGNTRRWTYAGSATTSIDEANNSWTRTNDALGNLIQVSEPGSLMTNYIYNPLGNLTSVTQHGTAGESARTRTFTYDSLSRLLTSTNPEMGVNATTGTICYGTWSGGAVGSGVCQNGYDANGNLVSKTDARNVTVSFTYDALNRLLTKKAPAVGSAPAFSYTYGYDTVNPPVANGIGRLLYTTNGAGESEQYFYDPMGRMNAKTTYLPSAPSTPRSISVAYDLVGNITSLKYPDGRTVTQGFDGAGQMSSVTYSNWNGTAVSSPYLTVPAATGYDAAGHLVSASMGNGVALTAGYDNRERIGSLGYSTSAGLLWKKQYAWTSNNNLQNWTDGRTGVQRRYGYDNLNRLTSAQDFTSSAQPGSLLANGLNQSYGYDSFGNILSNGSFSTTYTAQNRMSAYSYDLAGNLLSNGMTTTTWDADSKLTTASGSTYLYGANGDRVEKQSGSVTDTVYFGDRPIARLSAGNWTDLIYGPSGMLAEVPGTQAATPTYRLTDHLGTDVGSVGSNGLLTNPMDYTPFGQQFSGTTTDPYQFTSKERDTESGLDYFGARYYGSSMGRWMSPDWSAKEEPVPYAKLDDPQSLNLYQFVRNNPLSNRDSDGHGCPPDCGGEGVLPALQQFDEEFPVAPVAITVGALTVAADIWANRAAISDAITSVDWSNFNYSSSDPIPMSAQSSGSAPSPSPNAPSNSTTPSGPDGPYKRPNNATTKEQRDSVQGKPCATCGATGQKNNADHKDPLVEQHYKGGIDKDKMKSPGAVRPQCQSCSNQQGGYLSGFSNAMKKLFGF